MRTRRSRLVVTLAIAAVVLTGCATARKTAGTASGSAARGLVTRTATAGPVEVKVTPTRLDATGARFAVELDNHAIELDGDYAATSTLSVNGTPWPGASWSGAGPGGHHRSGTLTFRPAGAASGTAQLRLGGLPEPVMLTWTLPS